MVMVSFLKKTHEFKEQINLLSTLLLLQGGQAMRRMQPGGGSCPLGKILAD